MATSFTFDELMAQGAAKPGAKLTAMPPGAITFEELMGPKPPPATWLHEGGFLRDKQSWKDMGAGAAAILDLPLSMIGFTGKVGAAGVGNIIETVRGDPHAMGTTNKKIADAIERTPWLKFAMAPVSEAFGLNTADTAVGMGMEKLGGWIDNAAKYWSEKTDNPETGEALKQAVEIAMLKGGAEALRAGKRFTELVRGEKVLPPVVPKPGGKVDPKVSESRAVVENYQRVLRGEEPLPDRPPIDAKGELLEGEAVLKGPRGEPPPRGIPPGAVSDVTPKGEKPAEAPVVSPEGVPETPPVFSDAANPYKVAGAAGVTGAAAWAMQNELDDDQLAAMGLIGAAGIVKLTGVPEANLLSMLKEGGRAREAAAAQIYRDNVPKLTRFLRKYERQGVQIEDAVQRTMEKGLRALEEGKFKGDSKIFTWLFRIAENEAKGGLESDGLRAQAKRIQAESLDIEMDEIAGKGRDDASAPSPHEQIADTSVRGRSSEQVALNNALGQHMASALDRLPDNFRRPFEMRELEGMEYAEIAEALGQPIGTVRSQINRAKEALQKSLREYGPEAGKVALVAGVGVAAAQGMDKEELAAMGLGGAAAMGAIKPKGGAWMPFAKNWIADRLKMNLGGRIVEGITPDNIAEQVRPANEWADRAATNYLNKHAGTETDPLKDVTLPSGLRWEDAMDVILQPVSSDAPNVWTVTQTYKGNGVVAAKAEIQNYLGHVSDYLKQNVPPEKLPQYDLVRAVKETKAWDERMAKEAAKAEAREANVALKRMESMTVAQDFPGTGMKLVKLDKPGDFAHESTVMGHSVRGYEPHKGVQKGYVDRLSENFDSAREEFQAAGFALDSISSGTKITYRLRKWGTEETVDPATLPPDLKEFWDDLSPKPHPDWVPESEKGMTEARFSSGHPDYGLGGWDAIKRGDAEVLSLRDAKGGSHVTVEIATAGKSPFSNQPQGGAPSITQIRGKGNSPVPERYQQQIADFLNSRKWGEVRDLDNAGILDREKLFNSRSPQRAEYEAAWKARHGDVRFVPEAADIAKRPTGWDGQRGSASPRDIFLLGATAAGATIGSVLNEDSPVRGAIYGALAGGLGTGFLATAKGRALLKNAAKHPDTFLGLVSTRLGKIAPELKGTFRNHERRVLVALDTVNDQVHPFLEALGKQPKAVQELVGNGLLNGDFRSLRAIPALASTFPRVQATLANIEGQLKGLGRFGTGVVNYFPRLVADYDGLKMALHRLDPSIATGLERMLVEATAEMLKKKNRGLTDVEQSIITNRYLTGDPSTSHLPGYAQRRLIRNVTPELQKFYEPPTESLLRYVSGAVSDIEAARFFGQDLRVNAAGQQKFTNVDKSIGALTTRLLESGRISSKQAMELKSILDARFEGGEKGMSTGWAFVRDSTNAALLGNVTSAATQLGDSLMTVFHFGTVPVLQGLVQKIRGSSKVTPKDLGIINHVAEELASKSPAATVLQKTLKYSGFLAIDRFAKGLGINAALNKYTAMARTPAGQVKLTERYGYAFEGPEMGQLIADLQAGRVTDRVQQLAFEALSDTQPVSKAEMTEAYLRHPNGRILYQLKTYMLKQGDIVRREAYDNIATGELRKMALGAKNLMALAAIYAIANVPGDVVKDWLSGREIDPFSTPKMVENVLQTFGFNRYASDRLAQGKVVETGVGMVTPPIKVLEDIALGRDKAIAYTPLIGRPVFDRYFGGNERREIAEKKLANKGKPLGTGETLSPAAKEYLRQKRLEKARERLNAQ